MAKKEKKAGKKKVEKQERSGTIVAMVRAIFEECPESDTKDIIDAVKEVFPDSSFSSTHVAYYRNKFRKEGMDIPGRTRAEKPAKKSAPEKSKKADKEAPANKTKKSKDKKKLKKV